MKKFLVVGCGGSGAKTLAYMMDQLKAELRAIDPTIKSLPKAWQFVSLDVPLEAESGPDGLPNVVQNGGDYVGIGSHLSFSQFDTGVSDELGKRGMLGEIATWAPRDPKSNTTIISDGAGQYRAIGRLLTLPALKKIRASLERAVGRMYEPEAVQELDELIYKATGKRGDTADGAPVVLIVSSMAGGAGASMFLDVCRVLSTVHNIDASGNLVFMYTPEIFGAIKSEAMAGAWPNSLALFGEVFAAQTGAAHQHDRAIFKAFGIDNTPDTETFARLFPIGSKMGDKQASFGTGRPEDVYRGFGRALAGLMSSKRATESFIAYARGNTPAADGGRKYFGWTGGETPVPWARLPWGSLGYAQVSMGRGRFAEYSAQRLARKSFDRLLSGHLDPIKTTTGEEQLAAKREERLPRIYQEISLDGNWALRPAELGSVQNWLGLTFGNFAQNAAAQAEGEFRRYFPQGQDRRVEEWRDELLMRLNDPLTGRNLSAILDRAAYSAVYEFADYFSDAVLSAIEGDLAAVGIPFVEMVLDHLKNLLQTQLVPMTKAVAQQNQGQNPAALPAGSEVDISPLNGKGTMSNPQATVDSLSAKYRNQFYNYFLHSVAGYLAPVLEDYVNDNLFYLDREINDAYQDLESASRSTSRANSLADVATVAVNSWPSDTDEKVDSRFEGAKNEIMLTDVEAFAADYETQLLATVQGQERTNYISNFAEAAADAARCIIRGEWESQDAIQAPGDTLAPPKRERSQQGNRAGWVSKNLTTPPTGGDSRDSQHARYSALIRPRDLIERARQWVGRKDYPFDKFISVDLNEYLTKTGDINDVEYERRKNVFVSAFDRALQYGRPLAAVDANMVRQIHGTDVKYTYNFSEIPLEGLDSVIDLVMETVSGPQYDEPTRAGVKNALTSSKKIRHIEVFGSYPNYSPIVFSSLFPHIAQDYAKRNGRLDSYWKERRTRPLAAALPITPTEREAMVAGWIIGRITGRIHIADFGTDTARAYVYDDRAKEWVSFPHPLLIPPAKMIKNSDWMSSVIESVLIAYANVQSIENGKIANSLRPYHLLRGLYDDGEESANSGGVTAHPAIARLTEFLATGYRPGRDVAGTSIDDRYAAFVQELDKFLSGAAHFVPGYGSALPGQAQANKPFAEIRSREIASQTPYYRDLAADVVGLIPRMRSFLDQAKVAAPNWGSAPEAFTPTSAGAASGQDAAPEFDLSSLDDTF
ncbi:tubulin-like doman-containing protein [Corynebacterium flavescens]|uniref:tubulin-like doman-containing protein n=1 Tax=Corynebacterium flavescens TaxID=28028 RepID=UPI003FD13F0D